jgi:ABC-type multidrug transport system fused ATPase/permease subunit
MVAYTGLIYRKVSEEEMSEEVRRRVFSQVLRLSSHSMNSITSGEITNLLSNDASRVEIALVFFNYLWVSRFFRKSLIG